MSDGWLVGVGEREAEAVREGWRIRVLDLVFDLGRPTADCAEDAHRSCCEEEQRGRLGRGRLWGDGEVKEAEPKRTTCSLPSEPRLKLENASLENEVDLASMPIIGAVFAGDVKFGNTLDHR